MASVAALNADDARGDREDLAGENAALRKELKVLRIQLAELERLADSDTLTPLLNRRAFMREVERAIARVARHGTPAAVMIADLDGLKAINDAHGHQAGDAALMQVGYCLLAQVRANDIVARIGGDEFALVLEELDEAAAAAKAESLASECAGETEAGPVTISVGYTMIAAGDTLDTLIARADATMYRVKRARTDNSARSR